MKLVDDLDSQDRIVMYKRLAEDAFRDHVLCKSGEDRWYCGKPDTSVYHFNVIISTRTIVLFGDIGDLIVHPTGDNPLGWLRSVLDPESKILNINYFMEKVAPAFREEKVFLAREADGYISSFLDEDLLEVADEAEALADDELARLELKAISLDLDDTPYIDNNQRSKEVHDSGRILNGETRKKYQEIVEKATEKSSSLREKWLSLLEEFSLIIGCGTEELPGDFWQDAWCMAYMDAYDCDFPDCTDWSGQCLWGYFALRKFVELLHKEQ